MASGIDEFGITAYLHGFYRLSLDLYPEASGMFCHLFSQIRTGCTGDTGIVDDLPGRVGPAAYGGLWTIKTLVDAGHIVITCGGGGIPVVDEDGKLSGVNAVIDKDNASSLLAAELGADYLIILTAVEKVAINFGKENQEWLSDLTVDQAKEYIAQEQFAKGSMLPKIEAAIRFAESGEGRRTLITLLDKAAAGIAGETGTVIHK